MNNPWVFNFQSYHWEGGAKLIWYLSATIQPLDGAGGDLASVSNVCEWQYQDLMHFPEAAHKEWKAACYEGWSL